MDNLPGITQWFRMGEKEEVAKAIEVLNDLRIREFRILFSWADWMAPGGPEWLDFVVKSIVSKTEVRLIPDLFYTPPELARKNEKGEAKTSHPPEDLSNFAKFTEKMIRRYGDHFDWLQIWNEPNWLPYWDWTFDPEAKLFSQMAEEAIQVVHDYGKKAALGGLSPYEPQWITLLHNSGMLKMFDSVGIHYSPSWKSQRRKWYGWKTELETARAHLRGIGESPEVWIAEAGYATPGESEKEKIDSYAGQIAYFEETRKAGADKTIWYSIFDQDPSHQTDNMINLQSYYEDVAYHFGLITREGEKKPLYNYWKASFL